jgi:hypothetical protein
MLGAGALEALPPQLLALNFLDLSETGLTPGVGVLLGLFSFLRV